MPRDKTANHIRLMAAAKEEFLEQGYEKASMRSIGGRCGLTAAGIYRHCKNKEDLFDQLVSPAVRRLKDWQEDHVKRYTEAARSEEELQWQDSWVDMFRDVVYPHMEEYHLLIAKSQGSGYGSFLHDFTEESQRSFWEYFPVLRAKGFPVRDITYGELHLLLTAYVSALFEPVIHNYSQEEALRCLETIEAFFLPGWKNLLGF